MEDPNNGSELENKTSGSPELDPSEKHVALRGVSCDFCSIIFPKTSNYYMVMISLVNFVYNYTISYIITYTYKNTQFNLIAPTFLTKITLIDIKNV
jgi:hypothetical protein